MLFLIVTVWEDKSYVDAEIQTLNTVKLIKNRDVVFQTVQSLHYWNNILINLVSSENVKKYMYKENKNK